MKCQRPWLRDLRLEKGLTQRELARQIGIRVHAYHRIETRGCFWEPKAMQQVADFLDFDVNLFGKSPEQKAKMMAALQERYRRPTPTRDPNARLLTVREDGTVVGNYWENLAMLAKRDEVELYGNLRKL